MRIEFNTQQDAQTFANSIHQKMIAADAAYAKSVSDGRTLRWAIPYRDLDDKGQAFGPWWVNLKERTEKVLTAPEKAAIKPYARK